MKKMKNSAFTAVGAQKTRVRGPTELIAEHSSAVTTAQASKVDSIYPAMSRLDDAASFSTSTRKFDKSLLSKEDEVRLAEKIQIMVFNEQVSAII